METIDRMITSGHSDHDHSDEEEHGGCNHDNMNVRAAFIHVISDLIQSIVVLITAILVYYLPNWQILDPILTFIFSILIIWTTVPLSKSCIRILMNAAPEGKSVQKTIQKFQRMPEVTKVQEIKVWSISKGKNILTAKIEVKNIGNNTLKILQDKARSLKFMHSTIEMI